jgi:ubiquinone/menaquinone biosynthesis C-methylase UbiE
MEVMESSRPHPEVDFESAYRQLPPWEIGAAQPVIAEMAAEGSLVGPVLDVGCGTGENALELARHGLEVVAVDSSSRAIELATAKATDRSLPVEFVVADAHQLDVLGRRFPTVMDSALLHVIDGKPGYSEQLAAVIQPNGRLILLEISDKADIPYPKISEAEIRKTFASPRRLIQSLATVTYQTQLGPFPAWLGIVIPAHPAALAEESPAPGASG